MPPHRNDEERDPGLPVQFGPASNGEYDPEPSLPPVLAETVARARAWSIESADRLGMSRREFLLSVCGAATTFLALNACTAEEHTAGPSSPSATGASPGGTYEIPPSASVEPESAFEALGGEEFVFDIQGHLLEYHLNPVLNGQDFWASFPQQDCGEDDPRACYSIEHFLELMFLRSDTSMLVLSALPIFPERSPQGHDVMDLTRTVAGEPLPGRAHPAARPGLAERRQARRCPRRDGAHGQRLPGGRLEDVHALPRRLRRRRQRLVARRPRSQRAAGGGAVHPQGQGDRHEHHLHPQGTVARLAVRLARRHRARGETASRHELRRVPLRVRGRRARGSLRESDAEHGHEPPDLVDATRGYRAERERLRRDGHLMVVRDALPRSGRALPRQAACATSARTTCSGAPTACSTVRRSP